MLFSSFLRTPISVALTLQKMLTSKHICAMLKSRKEDYMQEERFEEFSTLISSIHENICKIKASYTSRLGLKEVHIFWIYLLNQYIDGLYASELASASKVNRSLVSREIGSLIENNVLCIDEATTHARYGRKFKLTDKGRSLAENISQIAKDIQDKVNQGISEKDLVVFYKTLHMLASRFDRAVLDENGGNNENKNNQ